MPFRTEISSYGIVVSAVDHGRYWTGVAYIFRPDSTHQKTIQSADRCVSLVAAETVARQLGEAYVAALVASLGACGDIAVEPSIGF